MSNLTNIKENDIVRVIGSVSYGDEIYDVDCIGVVNMINKNNMLITLDEVDGDRKVGCIVKNKYIEPLTIVEIGNILTGQDFSTKEEFLDYLSNEFDTLLDDYDDAQEAFNRLDRNYSNYLSILGCLYSLFGGESWELNVDEKVLNICSLEKFQEVLNDNSISSIEEVISKLTHKIMNTMSNVGCDVYNALSLEMEDFDDEVSDCFSIYSKGDGAKIELIDDIM